VLEAVIPRPQYFRQFEGGVYLCHLGRGAQLTSLTMSTPSRTVHIFSRNLDLLEAYHYPPSLLQYRQDLNQRQLTESRGNRSIEGSQYKEQV
jgi:hypothetical protein